MKQAILAIDLSSQRSSLAIRGLEAEPHSAVTATDSVKQGPPLMAAIDRLLNQADCRRSDLFAILAGTGPGSYTGLRIACTTARTLAFALNIPSFGLSSFAAATFQAPEHTDIHLLLDAYRGEVYHATYHRQGNQVRCLQPPHLLSQEAAALHLGEDALYLGDPSLCKTGSRCVGEEIQPQAVDLLALFDGQRARFGEGLWQQLKKPEPQYLRAAAFPPAKKA
ncbi:MAG: tRNA (adenosine(37)-N6)-threonylcarbamoyltransferase complex dimerization subunit type 1 TsaB [Planctomycetota bacterium]|nr:MAG: tRNA (adenosine(37)-N6)-threonylcarbamoyltransferase complex dimerization subunit type 1 TsaB [Planctomycetota bacterium]